MSSKDLVKFTDYLKLSKIFYDFLGMEPFKVLKERSPVTKYTKLILFILTFLNINLTIISELIFLIKALKSFSTFLEATALAPCLGFCIIAEYKIFSLWNSRSIVTNFIELMNYNFPKTEHEQNDFEARKYAKLTLSFEKGYCAFLIFLIIIFNSSGVLQTVIEYYFLSMPLVYYYAYFLWYPFPVDTPLIYSVVYTQQVHAGCIAIASTLAVDLLFISMVMLCCMHFDNISKQIKKFEPNNRMEDNYELKDIIKKHQIVLELSDDINEVFSVLVLFNFLASSMIICLVGFQVTAGISALDLFKYMLFLIFELVQVFTLCFLGNKLMDSSSAVNAAAFEQTWFEGDLRYRKAIMILMMRAQKPAIINAKTFAVVSLESFTKVLSTSYQFFALLKTMYSNK